MFTKRRIAIKTPEFYRHVVSSHVLLSTAPAVSDSARPPRGCRASVHHDRL